MTQDLCKTLHKPCTNTEQKLTQNLFYTTYRKNRDNSLYNTLYKTPCRTHTQPIHNPCWCAPGLGPDPCPLVLALVLALVQVLDLVLALALVLAPVLAPALVLALVLVPTSVLALFLASVLPWPPFSK